MGAALGRGVQGDLRTTSDVYRPEGGAVALEIRLIASQRVIEATPGAEDVTLILPAAHECRDLIFTLYCLADAAGDIVLLSQEETPVINLTLTITNDYAMVYSDGNRWWIINEVTT